MNKLVTLVVLVFSPSLMAEPWEESPSVRAMKDELSRSMSRLVLPDASKPYFMSYSLYDLQHSQVRASLGALVSSASARSRSVDIDLRIGDYSYDNSNFGDGSDSRSITLPVEEDYDTIRRDLWIQTDRQYKRAVEMLVGKRAVKNGEAKSPDEVASFSKEPPSHITELHAPAAIEQAKLEALAKKLSAVLRKNRDAYTGTVSISQVAGLDYFVSSEGSASVQPISFLRIVVECGTQADDGMPLHGGFSVYVTKPDQMPAEADLIAKVEAASKQLSALRTAPVVDDYAGPVLFRGIAAAQLVRTLLAEDFGGTPAPTSRPGAHGFGESELVGKLDQRILPVGVSVVDDPTIDHLGKLALAGASKFDEEGVPVQKVSLVENGVLKRFLMSRIPRKGFEHSNGHAASAPYSSPRAHPANLVLSSMKATSDRDVAARAVALAKEQGLKYVIVVDELEAPELDLAAAVVKRRYADGHEELVRGARLRSQLTMRSLKDIIAVGNSPAVVSYLGNGVSRYSTYDASAGYSVSIAAPSLLLRDADVKKPIGAQRLGPLVPRPTVTP
jgi:hypothetical protein